MKTFDEAFMLIAPERAAKEDPDTFERLGRDLKNQTDECFMNGDFTRAILTAVRHLVTDLGSRPSTDPPVILASHLSVMFVLGLRVGMEMEKAE